MTKQITIVVLTFNCAEVIERTLTAARQVGGKIICIDSFSTDSTVDILRNSDCELHQRRFKHYSDQRNWAIENFGNRAEWQLHLDADEILDANAIASIQAVIGNPGRYDGYMLRRRTYFLGKELRHAGTGIWQLRLFRSGLGACEDRLYDQHFICKGSVGRLGGWLHDMNCGTLSEWTARHNRWSDLEAQELLRPVAEDSSALQARLSVDPRQRRRMYKGWYYRSPLILRAWGFFFFRYIIMLGFLDGRAGLLFAFFQALWFRMLVDAKLIEARSAAANTAAPAAAIPAELETSR
jgi:glycosyltransferase involved in cell wall biosynthesis